MIKRILTLFSAVVLLGLFFIPSGCVKEDFDTTPPLENIATWNKTVTIAQLKTLYIDKAGIVSKLANDESWNAILAQGAVIEGYVISSDSAKNFYETVTIMDETGGIELKINDSELYLVYGLKPGQKVLVRVNDLALDNYNGAFQLGLAVTDNNVIKVSKIAPNNVSKYIQLSGRKEKLEPIKVKINEITDALVLKLITIDSVQFWNNFTTYSVPGENTNRYLIDKNNNKLILRTSGFASFANQTVPFGSGTIVGVLSKFGSDYQLYIRSTNDLNFVNDPLVSVPVRNKSIAELKAMYTSGNYQITENVVVKGMVVGNDISGNLYRQLFIEDESAGIEFKVYVKDLYKNYPVGTIVTINCNGMYLGTYGGVVQLGGLFNGNFGNLSEAEFNQKMFFSGMESVVPSEVSIPEINDGMIGKLVKLQGVQFVDSDLGKKYADSSPTNRTLKDANGNTIIVRTSNYADFATMLLPSKSGTITAILTKYYTTYQLSIVKVSDVAFDQPRF